MVAISFPCAITKTQKITIYYVEKVGGMLRYRTRKRYSIWLKENY